MTTNENENAGAGAGDKANGKAKKTKREEGASEAWAPTKGGAVGVNVLMHGNETRRCEGVCIALKPKGKIDVELTMPNGRKSVMEGVGPASESQLNAGYLEPIED